MSAAPRRRAALIVFARPAPKAAHVPDLRRGEFHCQFCERPRAARAVEWEWTFPLDKPLAAAK